MEKMKENKIVKILTLKYFKKFKTKLYFIKSKAEKRKYVKVSVPTEVSKN